MKYKDYFIEDINDPEEPFYDEYDDDGDDIPLASYSWRYESEEDIEF